MYLIANPVPADDVDYYNVEIDGTIYKSDPEFSETSNEKRLHFELPALPPGPFRVRVQAVNAWGEGEWSDPFVFTALSLPTRVTGLKLSQI